MAKDGAYTLSIVDEYMLAGALSVANGMLPTVFKAISYFERYENEQTTMTINIVRMFFMRIGTIYAVSLALYVELELASTQSPPSSPGLWGVQQECCAGTTLGQEAYKLVLTDIFAVLGTEVATYIFMATCVSKDGKVEMDLVAGLIFLCYRQSLICIGMLFAPPLAFLGVFGACLSFYVYYWVAFRFCKPPESKLSSRVSSSVFMQAMGLTLILTAPIIMLILRVYEPNCGAFAEYPTIGSGLEFWARLTSFVDPETGLAIAHNLDIGVDIDAGETTAAIATLPEGAEIVFSDSWVMVLLSDTAVLYAFIFVMGILLTYTYGKVMDRQEQCLQMAYALDVAHAELEAKKNVIFCNEFTHAASRVEVLLTAAIERAHTAAGDTATLTAAAGSSSQPASWPALASTSSTDGGGGGIEGDGTVPDATELSLDDIEALEVLQCCMTYDGVEMLQASNCDEIVSSNSSAWLHELLVCPAETLAYLRDDWMHDRADGSRCTVRLAIYPATYASASSWEGLFEQLYTSHQAVWELSQHVTTEMFQTAFHVLEADAMSTYLHGKTFAEVFAAGKSDPGFMSTEHLLDIATHRRLDAVAEGVAHKKELITAAELRGWLYHKLGVAGEFGRQGQVQMGGSGDDGGGGGGGAAGVAGVDVGAEAERSPSELDWLISNRAVSEFGEVYFSYDITDLLDPR